MKTDETTQATYADVFWAKGPVQLTTDEWWLTRLCELRNAIVHGDHVPAKLWHHDGGHQLNHVHDRLLDVLRVAVSGQVGDPLLRMPSSERSWARASSEAL